MLAALSEANVLAVTVAALITALATGLGALPLAFVRRDGRSWVGVGNTVAALLMVAASGMLFLQGGRSDSVKTFVGAVSGIVAISLAARSLGRRGRWRFGRLSGSSARVASVFVGVMTVHSISEGVGVGVAFGDGKSIGFLTAFAIAVHNIPEGLAISLVLVPRGVGVVQAAGWSIVSSLPQPLFALPAFFFVETFSQALPVGLGFAGGAMLWMVGAQIIPDTLRWLRQGRGSVSPT